MEATKFMPRPQTLRLNGAAVRVRWGLQFPYGGVLHDIGGKRIPRAAVIEDAAISS